MVNTPMTMGNDDVDSDFLVEYNLIGLHVTDNNKSYKSNNVELVESKGIRSNKSNKIESIELNIITTKLNKLYELSFLCVCEEDLDVHNEDRSRNWNPSIQELKPIVCEPRFYNFSKKEVKGIMDKIF